HQSGSIAETGGPRHVYVAAARLVDRAMDARGAHDDAAGRLARPVHGGESSGATRSPAGRPRAGLDRQRWRYQIPGERVGHRAKPRVSVRQAENGAGRSGDVAFLALLIGQVVEELRERTVCEAPDRAVRVTEDVDLPLDIAADRHDSCPPSRAFAKHAERH